LNDLIIVLKTVKNSSNFYNKTSGVYNLCLDCVFSPGRYKVAQILNAKNCLNILEIGSGTGSFVSFLDLDTRYIGIDSANEMCRISIRNYPDSLFLNIKYEDYHPEIKFNAIVINYTLSVVDDPKHLLEKTKHWLAKDGRVYIVNHFSSDNWFYKQLQKVSIHFGYNAYFPFNPKLFSNSFNITIFESVNLFGGWKFIELTPKKDEQE
jgi:ubiquinone/menaquinone biosynthesis C-methylase UbiE